MVVYWDYLVLVKEAVGVQVGITNLVAHVILQLLEGLGVLLLLVNQVAVMETRVRTAFKEAAMPATTIGYQFRGGKKFAHHWRVSIFRRRVYTGFAVFVLLRLHAQALVLYPFNCRNRDLSFVCIKVVLV